MDASRNRKLGVAAVVVVALAAGGAALAAGKLHGSGGSSSGLRGGPPGFSGGAPSGTFNGPRSGYGFGGSRGGFGPDRDHFGGPALGGNLQAAATYLGLSETALRTQLSSGKTLAQIANATSGKSASGLVDALVSAEKKELQQAVSSGRLSQTQADQLEANLKTRIGAMVNGSFGPGRGDFGRPDGDQGGYGFGGPPNGSTPPSGGTSTTPATHI